MGKLSQHQPLPVVRQQRVGSRIFCCRRCSTATAKDFNCKCVFVLLLSVSVFISALFSFHLHSKQSGYDAKEAIKISATVQAYLRLQKPVSQLVPHISELEYDIFGEIGVPFTKVAILSMHQAAVSNITDVVFGVLSDPLSVSINPVHLSLLKSSLVELFLQRSNLTLTNTTFGQPSSLEILKFPGGITLIPEQSPPFGHIPQILFNFTLNNSIYEIKENFVELKRQLKLGLHLLSVENVYIQVTSKNGTTRDPPVVVEASITSNLGIPMLQRLRQLAEILTVSSAKNLGLDKFVFGKVKEVSLSSYLNLSLHALPPTPPPFPSSSPSPSPSLALPFPKSDPLAPSPNFLHLAPCSNCDTSAPSDSSHMYGPGPLQSSSAPSVIHISPSSPSPSPISHSYPPDPNLLPSASAPPPSTGATSLVPPCPPLPVVSYGSDRGWDNESGKCLVSPPHALPTISASSSYLAVGSLLWIWWMCLFRLFIYHVLCTI